jgi:hypothetical protein
MANHLIRGTVDSRHIEMAGRAVALLRIHDLARGRASGGVRGLTRWRAAGDGSTATLTRSFTVR